MFLPKHIKNRAMRCQVASRAVAPKAEVLKAVAPKGFTMIELMVSLALLGVVLSLVYTSFFQISSGSRKMQERLLLQQDIRLLMKMISDDMTSAQWLGQYRGLTANRGTGIVSGKDFLNGENQSRIDFHAAIPARFHRKVNVLADPGLHEVGYRVQEVKEGEGLELVRREDYYLDDEMDEGGVSVALADGITLFKVEYLETASSSTELESWSDEWDSTTRPKGKEMPVAIKITLRISSDEDRMVEETLEFNLDR